MNALPKFPEIHRNSQFTRKDDMFLDEELEKFQRDLDNLEALNVNIQGSLNQFQKVNPRNNRAAFNNSRSIDITKTYLSPKNILLKNPSVSFFSSHLKSTTGYLESNKEFVSRMEIDENKDFLSREEV